MSVPNKVQNLTRGVVASFESGIGAVSQLIEKGLEILDGYRAEQEAIRGSLREAFAEVGSLRRKDFDGVMERILSFQSLRESDIKKLIKGFLERQKDLTGRLRRSLEAGIFEEVNRCKDELSKMIGKAREEIQAFQKEQQRIQEMFTNLETQKGEITPRDFKKVIQDLEQELFGTENQSTALAG